MVGVSEVTAGYKTARAGLSAFRKTKRWLTKVMFQPTLKISHEAWLESRALGVGWEEIGEGIEFSEALARWPEEPRESYLAIRSTRGEYDTATVVVEAESGGAIYDDTRIVSGLGKKPRIIKLPSIPAFRTYVADDGDWIVAREIG